MENKVTCPYCEHLQDDEVYEYVVTYWGEDPPVVVTCDHCDKEFLVNEHVTRAFECTKRIGDE
jgi:hypothetical protein